MVLWISRNYPYLPHGGSRIFWRGRRIWKRYISEEEGSTQRVFFPEGVKWDWINTIVLSQTMEVTKSKKCPIHWSTCKILCHIFSIIVLTWDKQRALKGNTWLDVKLNKMAKKRCSNTVKLTTYAVRFLLYCAVISLNSALSDIIHAISCDSWPDYQPLISTLYISFVKLFPDFYRVFV